MERIVIIDNLRGIAFLFMVFQHIFYFNDVSNNYKTHYSNNEIVDTAGLIARSMFILLAGYSVSMAYAKDKKINIKKRFKRSLEILSHGIFITGLTYILYPEHFVRFGILHFLAVGTLLISFVSHHKLGAFIALLISMGFSYPNINPLIDTITGAHAPASMMDWFPLNKWMPVILSGLVIGQNIDISKLNLPFLEFDNTITEIGKNSLNLYTIHVTILLVLYKIKNFII
jgi:uncharacterized membrane protein